MSRPLRPCWLLPALLLALAAGDAAGRGNVYRWTDAQGNVQYGDRVPPGVAGAQHLPQPAPSNPEDFAELQVLRVGEQSVVTVRNLLAGPVQVELHLAGASNVLADPGFPQTRLLAPGERLEAAVIVSANPGASSHFDLRMMALPGDPAAEPQDVSYSLPIDESRWQLGQGFHGGFSHEDEQNRYAVDLVVAEGTPVLAARAGTVVQVESGFDGGGTDRDKYANRANLIRIVHDDGSMALYAHLQQDGALVRPGQRVYLGQHIGYAGNTGFSSGPHLHFAVQVNVGMRLVSIPFRMIGPQGFLPLRSD